MTVTAETDSGSGPEGPWRPGRFAGRSIPCPAPGSVQLFGLSLLVVDDLCLQHPVEAHAVPVLRDVDVEVAPTQSPTPPPA
jgi:hypothetical protein